MIPNFNLSSKIAPFFLLDNVYFLQNWSSDVGAQGQPIGKLGG
jgi:hypothetical protein